MNKKFYKCTTILLCLSNLILVGVVIFFNSEIGLVRVSGEFGSGYGFFYKKKDMHRIFYIDPVGERNLDRLSDEDFNELSEYCAALSEDNYWYKADCGPHFIKEVKRREAIKRVEIPEKIKSPHRFRLLGESEPYRNIPYIMHFDGETVKGITNENGETEEVYVSDEDEDNIDIKIDWDAYFGKEVDEYSK
ncbi:hypothetical protein ACLSZN_10690 [Avibacterium avium]|uniref:hypothetical protein n=1 Tax=Avibacterium TaxID=292486 RepID=UPI0022460BA6|nr:hypothetical protein [Avibacterium sp. 21-594]MCW9716008.1 hypothetical protein [Avibacterium sp. 21-594]